MSYAASALAEVMGRFLGQTLEQANSAPPLLDGEVVGRWRRDVLPPGWLTIVRRDNQLIARWDYADGSNSEDSLDESRLPDGRLRFAPAVALPGRSTAAHRYCSASRSKVRNASNGR